MYFLKSWVQALAHAVNRFSPFKHDFRWVVPQFKFKNNSKLPQNFFPIGGSHTVVKYIYIDYTSYENDICSFYILILLYNEITDS